MSQVALVTGAAQGLGHIIAGQLLAAGFRVAVTDRTDALAAEAAASLGGGRVFGPDLPDQARLGGDVAGEGERVTVAGLITSVQHRVAKQSGNPYGMITVEDFNGEVTVMFMGKTYTEFQEYVTSKFYVLPLYQTQDNLATTKKVHGVTIDGASGQPFGAYTIWLDQ